MEKVRGTKGISDCVRDDGVKKDDAGEKMVPLKALEAERKKYKEQIGVSREELLAVQEQLRKQDLFNQLYMLSRSDYYADAVDRQEEIRAYMAENGGDVRTAYNALFAEERYEAVRKQAEEDVLVNLSRRAATRVDALSGGDGNDGLGGAPKLTRDQMEVAKNYGMSAGEYVKYMKQ